MPIGKPNPVLLDLKRWNKSASNILLGNMVLDPDFKEFFQLLNKNNVKYLVIGGFAVAFHGYPRYTKDIDIWLRIDPDNVTNVVKTLDDFGFHHWDLQMMTF
jgi:hypothetical protein